MHLETLGTVCSVISADPKILGETYGFWCQTIVLFSAACLAYLAIVSSRLTERKKAAIEAISDSRKDDELTMAIRLIATLHAGDKNMASYAKEEAIDSPEAKSIRYALNHYESVSVGILQKIYDEGIFKSTVYTSVTRLYDRCKPYIDHVRSNPKGSSTNWQELECLACRWKLKPLKKKSVRSFEPNWFRDLFR